MPRKAIPPEELSTKPSQMRNRIRRRTAKMDLEVQNYVQQVYQRPVEEWDWEELAKGRPRNKNGQFVGRAPNWITPYIVKEARRRLVEGIYGELGASAKYALQTLHRLVSSGDVDDKVALDASKYILNHIIGNPKAIVEVDASDNVRQFLARALVLDDGAPQHEVIDGQYTTDEEDDDDDE